MFSLQMTKECRLGAEITLTNCAFHFVSVAFSRSSELDVFVINSASLLMLGNFFLSMKLTLTILAVDVFDDATFVKTVEESATVPTFLLIFGFS